MKYDLEKRTIDFSKSVIDLCKKTKPNYLNLNIINQLLRSATSVGANYREANGASSKSDFRNKIHLSKKEIKETQYWLELLSESLENKDVINKVSKEAHELALIFNKISSTLKINN